MSKDTLFGPDNPFGKEDFVFDARVSQVFDDMVNRSVPGYQTIQLLVADLALRFANKQNIVDLGCSTGNTLLAILARQNTNPAKLIGIDSSKEMLSQCEKKLHPHLSQNEIKLQQDDITDANFKLPVNTSVVILNLVLQFVRPVNRLAVLQNIHADLAKQGCVILVEKTQQKDNLLNDLFIDYYHSYKKEMGYTDLEISQKREALENRLIPFFSEENTKLLQQAGFTKVTSFFQWMNFQGYLAIKE
ncbi:MAG: carboxy-S-adenosyl-L-methionine synthase CmoA [Deltaproteobacteria bacterium]|nr:carboxy-S-adenosyl-L-methionine synthase CmoA [Deltaproteobacteria bacterium]